MSCDRNQGIQKIGTAPGFPWQVVSAAGTTYVASTIAPDDADTVTSTLSTLYRVDADGSSRAVTDNFINAYSVISLGANVGFLHVAVDSNGGASDDAVETIDASGAMTTLASANHGESFDALTTDGSSNFAWYRWPADRTIAVPIIEQSAIGGTPTKLTFSDGVTSVGRFVTDGTSYYGVYGTTDEGYVVGRMPVGGAPALVFASGAESFQMLGVDDKNVTYLEIGSSDGTQPSRIWSVPKTGGTPAMVVATNIDSFSIIVRAGAAYWIDHEATQANIMTVGLDGVSPLSEVSATSFFISAIGASDCGLVLASEAVSPGSTTLFQLPL